MKRLAALLLATILCVFSCTALKSLRPPAVVAATPPAQYHGRDLSVCKQNPNNPAATCCAYGFLTNTVLCFDVLCSADGVAEYDWADTVCVPPSKGPDAKNETQEESSHPTASADCGSSDTNPECRL